MRTTELRQARIASEGGLRWWLLGALLVLLGIVALASEAPLSGVGGPRTVAGGGAPRTSAPPPVALVLVAVAAFGCFLSLAVYQSRRAPRRRRPEAVRAPLWLRIATFAIPLAIVAVLVDAAISGSRSVLVPPSVNPGKLIDWRSRAAKAAPLISGHSSFSLPAWVPLTLLALAVLAVLALVIRRIGSRSLVSSEHRRPATVVGQALEQSIDELRADPNARRAVIAAYRRMEAALAAAGLSRWEAEAPREYLVRTLGSLNVSPAPPRRLTALFERARFSVGQIDQPLRDSAIDALLSIQRELEAVA